MAFLFDPHFQAVDSNGAPRSGAKLYFYQTGTTTKLTIYSDNSGTTQSNPVVADTSGLFAPVYLTNATFKVVLSTSADVVVQTIDPAFANLVAGGTFGFGDGSVGAPSISFNSDSDTGIYRIGSNSMGLSAGGSLVLQVDANGITPSKLTMLGAANWATTVTIASATTTNIGAAASNELIISGTTTITAFDTVAAGITREVVFSGALILTHNNTSLILPGSANITTAANDSAAFRSLGSGNWLCLWYKKASGASIASGSGSGQTLAAFPPVANEYTGTNYAALDLRNGHPILVFPDAVVAIAVFTGILPAAYGGGGITVEIEWMCSTTSTNKVCFGAYIEYMDVGTTDFDSDSFASELIDTTGVAANATSGISAKTSIAFTNGAAMDSLVAGAVYRLKIARETGQANDTNAGDIQVLAVRVKET